MSDYISREAAIGHYRVTDPAGTFAYCASIIDFLENLPAADVRDNVRGEWIIHEDWLEDGLCGFECSICGMCMDWDSDFCPRCGAKMERVDRYHA